MPSKDELIQHIQTLNGLIDGESDELGQMLTPIIRTLEKIVTPMLSKDLMEPDQCSTTKDPILLRTPTMELWDFYTRIRGGGDDAIAAVKEYFDT